MYRSSNGTVTVEFRDNLLNRRTYTDFPGFERGDVVTFHLTEALASGMTVSRGDTVGVFDSIESKCLLAVLKREQGRRQAELAALEAGEKSSVIESRAKALEHAREQLKEQEKIVRRMEVLSGKGYLPYEEYERAVSTRQLLAINVDIAQSDLQTVRTGAKKQDMAVIEADILGYEREIGELEEKIRNLTVTSPLSGSVIEDSTPGVIIHLADTSEYLLHFPVQLKNRNLLHQDDTVYVEDASFAECKTARLRQIGNVVGVDPSGQYIMEMPEYFITAITGQYITAVAVLQNVREDIVPGSMASCRIEISPVLLRNYLLRMLNEQVFQMNRM